jgi:predicted component of type VI protein secretion system
MDVGLMPLTLEVIGRKAAQMGGGVRKVFQGGGTIGRLDDNDWVFPDQYISGRHAKISCVGGTYLIEDTSTNGVFINSPQNRIPRGQPQPLHNGDTVYIDDYELRVTLDGDYAAVAPVGGPRRAGAAREPYISEDPFFGGARQVDPDEIDPMKLLDLEGAPARLAGPSAADLAGNSLLSQHYRPPTAASPPPLQTLPLEFPSDALAGDLIPDDYDPLAEDDVMVPIRAPSRTAAPPAAPAGVQRSTQKSAVPAKSAVRSRSPGAAPASDDLPEFGDGRTPRGAWDPRQSPVLGLGAEFGDALVPGKSPAEGSGHYFGDAPLTRGTPGTRNPPGPQATPAPSDARGTRNAASARSVSGPRGASAARDEREVARTTAPFPGVPSPSSSGSTGERRSGRAGSRAGDLNFSALLAAAGLESARVSPELAEQFGQIMRVVVAGLMDVLQARGKIKDEFRMRLTSFKQRDNNPLKFSANVEDALHNILVKRNTAYLGPVEAFEDAFEDVRNHQMAMLAGMRVAYDEMLAEFDPQRLQKEFEEQMKGKSFLSGSAKQKYWELYCARFRDMVKDADSCFRHLFGDEFAKAYEEQLARLKTVKPADRQ